MLNIQVIAPLTRPREWVSSLFYPHKPDGTLCICLDPHDLNKAILHEFYKTSTLHEISHWLNGAKDFSKLDARNGFWSIPFSLHAIWFKDEPGCICIQEGMDQITDQLPSIIAIHDEICIYGWKPEEHNNHIQLMKTASQNRLVSHSKNTVYSSQKYVSTVHFSPAKV